MTHREGSGWLAAPGSRPGARGGHASIPDPWRCAAARADDVLLHAIAFLIAVLSRLAIFLIPDGKLPSRRWRWVLWAYLAACAAYSRSTSAPWRFSRPASELI